MGYQQGKDVVVLSMARVRGKKTHSSLTMVGATTQEGHCFLLFCLTWLF